jgi:hypothetical protein
MNRNTLESLTGEAMKQLSELSRAANGMDAAHWCAGEGLEQSPPAGADSELPVAEVRLDCMEDALGQSLSRSLQVQHELSLGRRRCEQIVQAQLPVP